MLQPFFAIGPWRWSVWIRTHLSFLWLWDRPLQKWWGWGVGILRDSKFFLSMLGWNLIFVVGCIYFLAKICRNIFLIKTTLGKFFLLLPHPPITFLMVHPLAGTHFFVCIGYFIQRLYAQNCMHSIVHRYANHGIEVNRKAVTGSQQKVQLCCFWLYFTSFDSWTSGILKLIIQPAWST